MPRSKEIRKDLRKGLRDLHRYWKLSLDNKVRYANRLIGNVLAAHSNPILCWSGGKDSTVLLHLVLNHKPDIPVIFNDTGVEFPETRAFVHTLARDWNLKLHIAKPISGESFWDCVGKFGWPIFGKSQARSVEQANRTGNVREALSPFERKLVLEGIQTSTRCCEYTRERPTKRVEAQLEADVKFLGLLAGESRSRIRLFVDHGAYYYIKRYYGRGRGIWKALPLSIWREKDVWEYHERYGLPHCRLYDMGYTRNGCWPCAMGVRNGQLARLRVGHPHLFQYLMLRTPLGAELLKARLALSDHALEGNLLVKDGDTLGNTLRNVLEMYPCFFDKF